MEDGWYNSKMIVYYMSVKLYKQIKKENSFGFNKDRMEKWFNYNWKKMTGRDNLIDE